MKRKRVEKAGEKISSESSGGSKRPEKVAAVTETVTVKVKEKKSVLRLIKDIIAYVVIGLIALATIFILISKATNKVPFIFGNSIAWVFWQFLSIPFLQIPPRGLNRVPTVSGCIFPLRYSQCCFPCC